MKDLLGGQTSIPVPESIDVIRPCAWCPEAAVEEITLEKQRNRYVDKGGKRVKQIAHRAITAWVCERHKNLLQRNNPGLATGTENDIVKHRPNWMDWGKQKS